MTEAGTSGTQRAALPSAADLWASADAAVWGAVRESYESAVAEKSRTGKGKVALPDLDRWFSTDLPAKLTGVEPGITREDLVKLVDWKLARGKWRPQLQAYARGQPLGAVEAASRKALEVLRGYNALPSHQGTPAGATAAPPSAAPNTDAQADAILREALEALTELKGVGPATASALLSAACPSLAPYMGDEAMAAALPPGRKPDYTVKVYLELAGALRRKADQISCAGARWTAAGVEQCLWVAAVLHAKGGVGGSAVAGKREAPAEAGGAKAGKRTRQKQ